MFENTERVKICRFHLKFMFIFFLRFTQKLFNYWDKEVNTGVNSLAKVVIYLVKTYHGVLQLWVKVMYLTPSS